MAHETQDGRKEIHPESELLREIQSHLPDADVESLSIDSSNVCIFWKDRERRFVGANQAFLDFHGKSLDELIGHTQEEMEFIDNQTEEDNHEYEVLVHGRTFEGPSSVTVNGKVHGILCSESPIYDKAHNIIGIKGFFVDVTSFVNMQTHLREAALRDELTTLKNRRAMDEELKYALHQHIYMALFDVDHFKNLNDNLGHRYGDEILRLYAQGLRNAFGIGRCYRYGGDEFVVIGSYQSDEDIKSKYESFREKISHMELFGNRYSIHTSCGFAHGKAENLKELDRMLQEADHNLYQAKNEGRDRICGTSYSKDKSFSELNKDQVTGLPDANYFNHRADDILGGLLESGLVPAVIYTDAYGTHAYNDDKGYDADDRLLKEMGASLAEVFSDGLVVRYTDDRFAIVTGQTRDDIARHIDEVNDHIYQWTQGYSAGIRAGVYFCEAGDNIRTSLDRARRAKNYYDLDHYTRCHVYDDKVKTFVDNKDYILSNVDRALRENWIKAYYQPVMGSLSGKVSSFEALARWDDPDRGVLLPDDFLPDLDAVHLSYAVDISVLRTACRELREMREREGLFVPISVNLSASTLELPDIHETIHSVLKENGLSEEEVGFELYETGREGDSALLQQHFHRFREDGYVTFLDHFGEGKSSIDSLQDLEFNFLKMDIRDFTSGDDKNQNLLTSFTSMVKRLHANVAVVGVETKEQVDFLHSIGCSLIEGRYISEALPMDEIVRAVRSNGFDFETYDEHCFYRPASRVNVLDGISAFYGENGDNRANLQPVFILTLEHGVLGVIYENAVARRLEALSGRTTYKEFERLMNDRSQGVYALIMGKVDRMTRIGEIDSYNAVSPVLKARMRVQLISSHKGRRAYLAVGTDIVEKGTTPSDPGALDYWNQFDDLHRVDEVTGLPSIRSFQHAMAAIFRRNRREDYNYEDNKWALVYFDISQFAAYNQKHGFEDGNALLREFGRVIREEIGTDYLTRYYSDIFYAAMPDRDAENAVRTIHDRMYDNGIFSVNIHAGIYTLTRADSDIYQAIDRAKLAGEHVESNFNNYFARFEPQMEAQMIRANYLIAHLDEAMDKGWIIPYLQPIAAAESGQVIGFEVLARWNDPTYGFLNPAEFIDVLESAHLIYKLDLYMIEHVCKGYCDRKWDRRKLLPVSVNLSRYTLLKADIHECINQILSNYHVSRDLIHIEITESALVNNTEEIEEHIRRFHRDGYQVWMDDFGSGYSSLGALHVFDFDVIKIDMGFLHHENEKTKALLTQAVELVRQMGAVSLTEGVETQAQAEFLKSVGCTYYQGYYLSKPVSADRMDEVLKEKKLECAEPGVRT